MKVKCRNCKYEWDTKAELVLVNCPSCNLKTPNPNHKEKRKRKDK